MYAKGEADRRNVSVVSAGQGSEHTRIGCLNVSWYDPKRGKARVKQAGRGGIGTVLRDKKIKAIVVRYTGLQGRLQRPGRHQAHPRRGPAHQQGDRRAGRRAEQDAPRGHRAPGRDHGRLRPAADAQLPLRRAPRRAQDQLAGLGCALHPDASRRLLLRLHHGLLEGRGRLPGAHRAVRRADASPWTGRSTRRWRAAARTSASSTRPTSSS